MRLHAGPIGAAALLLSAGCSLLFDVDAREYGGGARADAAIDATTLVDAAGDAGRDAAGDAAGGDAIADAGVDAASPCKGGAYVFCDDFDDDASLQTHGWNATYVTGAAFVGHDNAAFLSSPNALLARTSPKEYATAGVHFDGLDPVGTLRLDFDLRVEEFPTDSVAIATIFVGSYSVRFGVQSNAHVWEDEWENSTGEIGPGHVLNASVADWTHVSIALKFVANQAAGSHITVLVGGETAYDAPASPSAGGGTPGITLGVIDGPDASCRIRVDNAIVTR